MPWANVSINEFEIDSLEDLEAAAHNGRLFDLAVIGQKKLAGIIDTLATRLGRVRVQGQRIKTEPSVEELLDVDREYRDKAASGELPTIAPRRFNPRRDAWLPISHTHRGERDYTALYSNTARAHKLGRTRDWLDERQATVITAQRGVVRGRRIVRGREQECEEFYCPDNQSHFDLPTVIGREPRTRQPTPHHPVVSDDL